MNMLSREAAPVFNAGLGALAAAAAVFFLYAMPADRFAALVDATGISSVISAARPPLGLTARLAAMGMAGTVMYVLVWGALRHIDRSGFVREDESVADGAALLPKLRRADAHPDAPARRPLLAREDLGEPVDAPPAMEAAEQADVPDEAEPVDINPPFLSTQGDGPTPIVQDVALEPAGVPPLRPVEDIRHVRRGLAERASAKEAEAPGTEDLMARLPLPEDWGDSVAVLFRRLDAGLASLEWPLRPGGQQAEEAPLEPQDAVGDQLRSALDDLRKMAGRGS